MQKDHSRMTTTTKDHAPATNNHQADHHAKPRAERAHHDQREPHDQHVNNDQQAGREGADVSAFAALGLSEPLLKALAHEGYTTPTPIQTKAMPHVLAGRDLFGCAQTGTGKTAAFALPLIERLMNDRRHAAPKHCRILVLAPTRELAGQIHDSFKAYGRHAHLKSAVIYGGVNQNPQASAVARGVDVLVATPGRLLDLIGQRLVEIKTVEYLVLDEADRMLDMGFIHDVRRIVGMLPRQRQTLFFSATLPAEVRDLAGTMLRDPLEVKTAPQATPAETVAQSVFHIPQKQKRSLLVHLLQTGGMGRVIVFTRTKRGANKLAQDLEKAGVRAAAIHGNKSQNQREKALADFKSPRPPVLIATDIAARGIDVDEVSHVVNFELPHEPEYDVGFSYDHKALPAATCRSPSGLPTTPSPRVACTMAKTLEVRVPHALDQDEIKRRLDEALVRARSDYADSVGEITAQWAGEDRMQFNLAVAGMKFDGSLEILIEELLVKLELPGAAALFSGRIREGIQERLGGLVG